jgi:putative CocE/NonD family hydrolase
MKRISAIVLLLCCCTLAQAQKLSLKDYEKTEIYIRMRDHVDLYTAIYQPRNATKQYPILMTRTPYGCAPYGSQMPDALMYNELLVQEGYIFVCQDIRGRAMSDGEDMINMKPVYSQSDPKRTDEATDAFDTIDWLVKHVRNNNGKVGMYGNSYCGWTGLMGAACGHKALKAVQAGAPCMDLYFEDFTRYGMFALAYVPIIDWFGTHKEKREPGPWWQRQMGYFITDSSGHKSDRDFYAFWLRQGALSNMHQLLSEQNYFYRFLREHPDYDAARKERSTAQYLKNVNCPVLITGGWNDEQNIYGITTAYKTLARTNKAVTHWIAGPWTHGGYRGGDSLYYVGNICYGLNPNPAYKEQEFRFFQAWLNGAGKDTLPALGWFNTGTHQWTNYQQLPATKSRQFYFAPGETLQEAAPAAGTFQSWLSDPAKPVPYVEDDHFSLFVATSFMTDDQRFAYKRPDVLSFSTDVLTEDVTVAGAMEALLQFATDHSDADLVVKLIDVLPEDRAPQPSDKPGIKMNGYQQMVRCGYIRGRYRKDFSRPEPFQPDVISEVPVTLLNVYHTFKKGHKIMVQIQSTLFPFFERNPQQYVPNIFDAKDSDFTKATHRIYAGSKITLPCLQ